MKRLILLFCMDGDAGKAMAKTLRNTETTAQLRDAATFDGGIEHCDGVVIMPDVAKSPRDRIEATYAGFVLDSLPAPVAPAKGEVVTVTPFKRKPGRPRKNAA
jgi:hypothetical protein